MSDRQNSPTAEEFCRMCDSFQQAANRQKLTNRIKYNLYVLMIFATLYTADIYLSVRREVIVRRNFMEAEKLRISSESDRSAMEVSDDEVRHLIPSDDPWQGVNVPRTEDEVEIQDCFTKGLYIAVITHSTVGFGDYYPKKSMGKVLVVLHICAVIYFNTMMDL